MTYAKNTMNIEEAFPWNSSIALCNSCELFIQKIYVLQGSFSPSLPTSFHPFHSFFFAASNVLHLHVHLHILCEKMMTNIFKEYESESTRIVCTMNIAEIAWHCLFDDIQPQSLPPSSVSSHRIIFH